MRYKLLFLPAIISLPAQAVTVDVRQEYFDDQKQNFSRLLLSHRFDSGIGASLESTIKSGGNNKSKPLNNIVTHSNEYSLSYQGDYKGLLLEPGVSLEAGDSYSIYKTYVKATYEINDSWWVAGKYRFEYINNSERDNRDDTVNRADLWVGYNLENWSFTLEGLYKIANHNDLYNNKRTVSEGNFRTAYKIGAWVPYVEVGNVPVRQTSDERQTRYRVGVSYTF
ncbi:oligogalacturonate-specific porin KdgM family protein [Yokenella regensburgei]|uniref:oligogalacturonate-specific porin KdgM family protein n=1 Tax=Yokenella regensburgei TaxID=158877 RepID=UPI003EDA3E6C